MKPEKNSADRFLKRYYAIESEDALFEKLESIPDEQFLQLHANGLNCKRSFSYEGKRQSLQRVLDDNCCDKKKLIRAYIKAAYCGINL